MKHHKVVAIKSPQHLFWVDNVEKFLSLDQKMIHCSGIVLVISENYTNHQFIVIKYARNSHTLVARLAATNQKLVSLLIALIMLEIEKKTFLFLVHIYNFYFLSVFFFVIMFQLIYSVSFLLFIKNCSFYIITHLVFA